MIGTVFMNFADKHIKKTKEKQGENLYKNMVECVKREVVNLG